jgi:imidazolonepropionase-like amidohydrolase
LHVDLATTAMIRAILVQGDEGPAELGTVEVGKLADLIVIAANPLDDIANVRRLQLVLKEGRVVSDKRHLSGAIPQPDKARF